MISDLNLENAITLPIQNVSAYVPTILFLQNASKIHHFYSPVAHTTDGMSVICSVHTLSTETGHVRDRP